MGESELRSAVVDLLREVGLSDGWQGGEEDVAGRIMDLVADYASERASDAAYDAIREYEERQ